MNTNTTITLAKDVPPGGDIQAVEDELLADLEYIIGGYHSAGTVTIVEPPAPYKTAAGEYRLMRDHEGDDQYTEVRVRAVIE